jgi:hypothetical protein
MKKALALIVFFVAAVATAYVAGYWPQHRAARQAETRRASLEVELAAAQARVRGAAVLGLVLTLSDVIAAQNYGTAQSLATGLFDAVREESGRTTDAALRGALDEVLRARDPLTAALARGDVSTAETVRGLEVKLRSALGYDLPPISGAATGSSPPLPN